MKEGADALARVSLMEEDVLWVTSSLTLPRTAVARPTEFSLFQILNDGDKEKRERGEKKRSFKPVLSLHGPYHCHVESDSLRFT